MFNISENSIFNFPTLVLPARFFRIQTDTSASLVLNLSITSKALKRDVYSGLCNVIAPDGNNDMVLEKPINYTDIEAIKFSEKDDSQKSSESIRIQKFTPTSAAARSIVSNLRKIHVRKQTLTKRKIDTDVFDEAKITKYDHSKQMNLQLAHSKSQTFHNNIINTMDKGLPKSYNDAYGVFLSQMAAAKLNDNQNKTLPSNNILGSIKPIENSSKLKYCSVKEIVQHNEKCQPETGIKCVTEKSVGSYTLLNASRRSFQCTQCKQHFLALSAFDNHLVMRKTTNSTTTQDSAQYGNKDPKKLSNGHENVKLKTYSLKDRIINTHKLSPRLKSKQNKIFQCKECKKTFSKLRFFTSHQIAAHSKYNRGYCSVLRHNFGSYTKNKNLNKADAVKDKAADKDIDKDAYIPKDTTNSTRDMNQNPKVLSNLDTLALVATKIVLKEEEVIDVDN